MQWITYEYEGRRQLGALLPGGGQAAPLAALGIRRPFAGMVELIAGITPEELETARRHWQEGLPGAVSLEQVQLLSPIPRPVHDILCVGVNYHAHLEEAGRIFDLKSPQPAKNHIYFSKRACAITGPGQPIPSYPGLDDQMDYEAELAVIIGRRGRDIPATQAQDYIFGYSVFNDVTARALQRKHEQWLRGKSLDGYAVMGPAIVHKSLLPFPPKLQLSCHVNGELRQQSNTALLIADLPTIISELSQGMTLEPGDIIATGTPGGVGMSFDPPRLLHRGDTVRCAIAGIGILENTIA